MRHKPTTDAPPAGRHGAGSARRDDTIEVPADPRNPGDEFLQREIDDNRRSEYWLIPKAILALAVVAALVVIREVFFR
jgi:hypothetical protein